jgi:hypothetical protein
MIIPLAQKWDSATICATLYLLNCDEMPASSVFSSLVSRTESPQQTLNMGKAAARLHNPFAEAPPLRRKKVSRGPVGSGAPRYYLQVKPPGRAISSADIPLDGLDA